MTYLTVERLAAALWAADSGTKWSTVTPALREQYLDHATAVLASLGRWVAEHGAEGLPDYLDPAYKPAAPGTEQRERR